MMKLGTVIPYLKKAHRNSANFVILENTDIVCILVQISNSLNFFESLRFFLINIVTILMIP